MPTVEEVPPSAQESESQGLRREFGSRLIAAQSSGLGNAYTLRFSEQRHYGRTPARRGNERVRAG